MQPAIPSATANEKSTHLVAWRAGSSVALAAEWAIRWTGFEWRKYSLLRVISNAQSGSSQGAARGLCAGLLGRADWLKTLDFPARGRVTRTGAMRRDSGGWGLLGSACKGANLGNGTKRPGA